VIPLRATTLIDAPEAAVHRAIGRADVWTRTARALGARAELATAPPGSRAPLRSGDLIRIRRDRADRGWWPQRSLILRVHREAGVPVPRLELAAGPLSHLAISLTTAQTRAGTYITVDVRARAAPALLTPLLRSRVLSAAQLLLGIVTLAAQESVIVVAGAVISDGKVLAARRTAPAELAGRWELPGGKVEPGETDERALARELAEELGLTVAVGGSVGDEIDLGGNVLLRCYQAVVVSGEPHPTEHDAVRWIGADDIEGLSWLESDRRLLPAVRRLLTG
jgi:8-oxo-dGTP diphosphatase